MATNEMVNVVLNSLLEKDDFLTLLEDQNWEEIRMEISRNYMALVGSTVELDSRYVYQALINICWNTGIPTDKDITFKGGKIPQAFFTIGYDYLPTIKIPDYIKRIGELVFSDTCFNKIELNNNIVEIEADCFEAVPISEIYLPDSLIDLGDGNFQGCIQLREISIPGTLQHLGKKVFDGCSSLTTIKFRGTLEQAKKLNLINHVYLGIDHNVKLWCNDGNMVIYGRK